MPRVLAQRVEAGWGVGLSRLHSLGAERRRSVLHQRDVIAQFHTKASGELDATVGDQADQDDFLNAVLLLLWLIPNSAVDNLRVFSRVLLWLASSEREKVVSLN